MVYGVIDLLQGKEGEKCRLIKTRTGLILIYHVRRNTPKELHQVYQDYIYSPFGRACCCLAVLDYQSGDPVIGSCVSAPLLWHKLGVSF